MMRSLALIPIAVLASSYTMISVDDDPFQPTTVFTSSSEQIPFEYGFLKAEYKLIAIRNRNTKVIVGPLVMITVMYRGDWRIYNRATVLGGATLPGSKSVDRSVFRCDGDPLTNDCDVMEVISVPVPASWPAGKDFKFQVNGAVPFAVTVPAEQIADVRIKARTWKPGN